jgi:hypothetical protein
MTSVVGLTEILNVNVTPTPGSVQDTNLTKVAGTAVATGTGASDAGTQRVVLSSDSVVTASEASIGLTGATPPTSANLAGFVDQTGKLTSAKVNATSALLVDGSAVTQPVSGTVSVNNFPATQPVSGTIAATQSGAWNVGTAESSTAITGTLSSNGTLVTTQTLGYNSISVQLTGNWVGAVIFQASNDNTNWVNVQGYAINSTMSAIDTAVDNDIYVFPVVGRYFQAVVTSKTLTGWDANAGVSTSSNISFSGTVNATAYLRTQSLAGIGEASLTQAMDQANNTPMNVTFPGMTSTVGQQSTVNSFPVALATEQIQDKFIVGRAFQGAIPINTVLTNDPSAPNTNGWIDCLQYRSVAFHIVQIQSATGGILTFEVSNDGVNIYNNPVGFFDTQGVDSTTLGASASTSLSTTGAKTIVRVGNIAWRYFRIRVTTAVTGTPNLQAFVTLRMTASPYVNVPNANISDIGGRTIPFTTVLSPNNALGTTNNTTSFFPIGGTDNSVVNPQIQGAPYPITSPNAAYAVGPYYRRNYVDFTGGVGAVGPDPRYAEDKTYPVNVRLERTTSGQDSVQDLLQQVLLELRALNHYTREMPVAIATLVQSPNAFNSPASMQDDPENFADDSTTFRYQKGH